MPPPSVIPSDVTSVTKNPVRENLSPSRSEFKNPKASDFDNANVSSMIRTTSKSMQNKFLKTLKSSYTSDGLETGSDSDVTEDTGNTYTRSYDKYSSNLTRVYDSRVHDRSGIHLDYDQTSKTRPVNVMDSKYNVSSLKPNISSLQSSKEDMSGRDNVRDLLGNYETPFLSEFTRKLSSRSLINTSASPTLSNLKSKHIFLFYIYILDNIR
jgi:hypothetical protein